MRASVFLFGRQQSLLNFFGSFSPFSTSATTPTTAEEEEEGEVVVVVVVILSMCSRFPPTKPGRNA